MRGENSSRGGVSEVGSVPVMEVQLAEGYGHLLETPRRGCAGVCPLAYGPCAEAGFGAGTQELVGLDAVAGNVARTSTVHVGQRCLSPFFPLSAC